MALAAILTEESTPIHSEPPPLEAAWAGRILKANVCLQKQDNWCWAAVAVGVVEAYGGVRVPRLRQCAVARIVNDGATCCPDGGVAACDVPHTLPPALRSHHDPTPIPPEVDKTFAFVKECIDAGLPIAVRVALSDASSGHFVLVTGYCVIGTTEHVYVCDPAIGHRTREAFTDFSQNYRQLGSWQNTYRTKGINGTEQVPEEISA